MGKASLGFKFNLHTSGYPRFCKCGIKMEYEQWLAAKMAMHGTPTHCPHEASYAFQRIGRGPMTYCVFDFQFRHEFKKAWVEYNRLYKLFDQAIQAEIPAQKINDLQSEMTFAQSRLRVFYPGPSKRVPVDGLVDVEGPHHGPRSPRSTWKVRCEVKQGLIVRVIG